MTHISRRHFLQWAAVSGVAGLAGCSGGKSRRSGSLENARVVIVGGGFGGATAARALRNLDPAVRITLIERQKVYVACPGSNQVIANLRRPRDQRFSYKPLKSRGIEWVGAEVASLDPVGKAVQLADGSRVPYDRLILSPGIDFRWGAIEGYDEATAAIVPHGWKGGSQIGLLRRQLRAMRNGGVLVMTVPANPYRCPPGPYERASLIAHFLSRYKPRSKILILDAKTQFSKQDLFQQGWRELYPGLIDWISAEKEGGVDRVDAASRTVHTHFNRYRADVLNIIPPQMAGILAQTAGLVDETGWCPVSFPSFESHRVRGIHVIGDACRAEPMPKSAFAAYSQAKVCAASVIELLRGNEPTPTKLINNCYSFLGPDLAISITGVYGGSPDEKGLQSLIVAETPPGGDRRQEAENATAWQNLFMREVFA